MSFVEVLDVGPRDGLQDAPVQLRPTQRARLVAGLLAAGVPRVEAVSFVRPDRVPRMAGAEEVVAALTADDRARCCGLVLNERGFERLEASGLREVRFALGVSDDFHRRNAGASRSEGLEQACRVLDRARDAGIGGGVILATSFGCPLSGEVAAADVLELARELARAGARELIFADTIGVAVPAQVRAVVVPALELGPRIGIHLHNTRNTGYASTLAAIAEGVTLVESSLGGLGGCPFSPGASGNIATEDLVHMLDREGTATGIDLDALLSVGRSLVAIGLALDSGVHMAGPFAIAG